MRITPEHKHTPEGLVPANRPDFATLLEEISDRITVS